MAIPDPILASLTMHTAHLMKAADHARSEVADVLALAPDSTPVGVAYHAWAAAEGHAATAERALTYLTDGQDPAGLLTHLRAHLPTRGYTREGARAGIDDVYRIVADVIPPQPAAGMSGRDLPGAALHHRPSPG